MATQLIIHTCPLCTSALCGVYRAPPPPPPAEHARRRHATPPIDSPARRPNDLGRGSRANCAARPPGACRGAAGRRGGRCRPEHKLSSDPGWPHCCRHGNGCVKATILSRYCHVLMYDAYITGSFETFRVTIRHPLKSTENV